VGIACAPATQLQIEVLGSGVSAAPGIDSRMTTAGKTSWKHPGLAMGFSCAGQMPSQSTQESEAPRVDSQPKVIKLRFNEMAQRGWCSPLRPGGAGDSGQWSRGVS
jgi:hypothetical protein